MALDVASFKASFPAFTNTPEPLVTAKLAEAELLHRAPVWMNSEKRELAIAYKTAVLLTNEPTAKCLRMAGDTSGPSIYEKQYQNIARAHAWGFRVL